MDEIIIVICGVIIIGIFINGLFGLFGIYLGFYKSPSSCIDNSIPKFMNPPPPPKKVKRKRVFYDYLNSNSITENKIQILNLENELKRLPVDSPLFKLKLELLNNYIKIVGELNDNIKYSKIE